MKEQVHARSSKSLAYACIGTSVTELDSAKESSTRASASASGQIADKDLRLFNLLLSALLSTF